MDQTRIGRHAARIGRCSGNTVCLLLRPGGILVLAWGQLRRVAVQARWQKLMGVVGLGLNVAVLAFVTAAMRKRVALRRLKCQFSGFRPQAFFHDGDSF